MSATDHDNPLPIETDISATEDRLKTGQLRSDCGAMRMKMILIRVLWVKNVMF